MTLHFSDGRNLTYSTTQVMGIINVSPDSFYLASGCFDEEAQRAKVRQMVAEGASMIDIGACPTNSKASMHSAQDEEAALRLALPAITSELEALGKRQDIVLSVDTFRADVAEMCVKDFGVDMINDVSGCTLDARMAEVVAETKVPYVLMHMRGTPQTMQSLADYIDVTSEVMAYLKVRAEVLKNMGAGDIIIDPGFGFAKKVDQNYEMFSRLSDFKALGYPLLVGISRKSMIYQTLWVDAEHALNGTTVLNTLAIIQGADILRVHDVKEAVEAVKLVEKCGISE